MAIRDASNRRAVQLNPAVQTLNELARVCITVPVDTAGGVLPVATAGTIVAVWGGGKAYDVEFTRPFQALVTLQAPQLKVLDDA